MSKKQEVATLPQGWQQRFKAASIRVGFQLNLSRPMLEFLCAVADDCAWDRATFGDIYYPDNWIATEASLTKRGLVERKEGTERESTSAHNRKELEGEKSHRDYRNYCQLTPAGEQVVRLLKVAGLFVESDTATLRKNRRKAS